MLLWIPAAAGTTARWVVSNGEARRLAIARTGFDRIRTAARG